jgi:N utilization substance protein A
MPWLGRYSRNSSLAIGRRGQHVRLAAQLTGWDIDIMTEAEESERRQQETATRTEAFRTALDVDDVIAHLLVAEGFTSVEDVALVALEDLTSIEGFDEEIAGELQRRAQTFIEERDAQLEARRQELGVSDDVAGTAGLDKQAVVLLGEKGVKTLEDLADLASDELREYLPAHGLTEEQANEIIMGARRRAGWFGDEEEAATEEPAGE